MKPLKNMVKPDMQRVITIMTLKPVSLVGGYLEGYNQYSQGLKE